MRLTDLLFDSLPLKRQILTVGARVPPILRIEFISRGLCALARRSAEKSEMQTNMGIDSRLNCLLPLDKEGWIFGLPEHYLGERGALELMATLGRSAGGVVDIGAHVGYYTYFLAKRLPDSIPIFYFEPDPALYALIAKNVLRNKLGNVTGFREAVGARTETSLFFQNLTDSFSGSLEADFVSKHTTRQIEVQVRAFDDFATKTGNENLCVKVDIEGAEQQFVDGAIREWWRISDLVIEVLGPAVASGFVRKLIHTSGMNAYYINDYVLYPSNEGEFTYRKPQYNWLFTRRSDSELKEALKGTLLTVHSAAAHAS